MRGEPGIGKTRLAEELAGIASAQGLAVAWGRCVETEGAPPYHPWAQVLEGLAALADDAGLERRAGGLAGELARIAPRIGMRLGVTMTDARDAADDRFAQFEAVRAFLRAEAERGLVVVLDDLHVADEPTLQLLLHVMRWPEDARILVVATHRQPPTETALGRTLPELVRERATERLDLDGLGQADVGALLRAVSGEHVPDDVAQRVLALTDGNPFFVQELGRVLGELPTVPISVREAIRSRLGALPDATREFLRAAAVVGRDFPGDLVARIMDVPYASAAGLLESAARARFIERGAIEGEHRFVHALVRDAVESDIDAAERIGLHAAAARETERYYAADPGPHFADLARYWSAAGDRPTAASWAERAADFAMGKLAYEDAARWYQAALDVGAGSLADDARCRLLLSLARSHYASGDFEPCLAACESAAEAGRRLHRPDVVVDAALVIEEVGEPRWSLTVRRLTDDALAMLGDGEPSVRGRLLAQRSHAELYLGMDKDLIETSSREALTLAEESGDPRAIMAALRARQTACIDPEHAAERLVVAEKMIEVGSRAGSALAQLWGHLWLFNVLVEQGDLRAAAGETESIALQVAGLHQPLVRWHMLRCRTVLAQASGRFDDALALCADADELAQRSRHDFMRNARAAVLSAVRHHTGWSPEDALPIYNSESPYGTIGRVGGVVWLLEAGRPADAAALYRTLGQAGDWKMPSFLRLPVRALGVFAARGLGELRDLETLYDGLLLDRERHVVGGGSAVNYLGPAELYLGVAAARLGRLDDAVDHLAVAFDIARHNGAQPYAVEAAVELADAKLQRGGVGDAPAVRGLAAEALEQARELGMQPFVRRAERLARASVRTDGRYGLTAREHEVAKLVARGFTNRQIADALVISERTAQNHVQHILTKLGFGTRAQIAAWASHDS